MEDKRLDTGLIIITEDDGQNVALLMQRMDDPGTKDYSVTLFGRKRLTELDRKNRLSKLDLRFLPLIEDARALFKDPDFAHELSKHLGKAELVVEHETEEFILQLYALHYQVPRSMWPSRACEVTRNAHIGVRQNDERDLADDVAPFFMSIHGMEALRKAFALFPDKVLT